MFENKQRHSWRKKLLLKLNNGMDKLLTKQKTKQSKLNDDSCASKDPVTPQGRNLSPMVLL